MIIQRNNCHYYFFHDGIDYLGHIAHAQTFLSQRKNMQICFNASIKGYE